MYFLKTPGGETNWEEIERDKNLHLLGSHLKLLSEISDTIPDEDLHEYMINLQQEFLTTFGMGPGQVIINSESSGSINLEEVSSGSSEGAYSESGISRQDSEEV